MTKQFPHIPRYVTLSRLFRFAYDPLNTIGEFNDKMGDTYTFYMGGLKHNIMTSNPDFIKHVLQKNHRNYKKSPIQTDALGQFLGKGLLTVNGDYWLRQRRLIQPGFHKQKLKGLAGVMQAEIEKSCQVFDEAAEKNEVIDVAPIFMKIAFRVVAKSLFSTGIEEDQIDLLANGVTSLQEFVIQLIRLPFLNPIRRINGAYKKHFKILEEMDELLMEVIQQRRDAGTSNDDLLDMLLSVRYEDTEKGMTDRQLLDETKILFVAGHETTGNALSWMLYLLTQHPHQVKKLEQEIQTILQDRTPTFTDIPQLQYTAQVINESMRLYPPAWITDRVAIEADEFDGVPIPKGQLITLLIHSAHRHNAFWENASSFQPERFEKSKQKEQHLFAFLPFGGGQRLCIGNLFAMMEMQLVLVHLIRNYEFELVDKEDVKVQVLVTLRPENGMKVRVKKK